MCHCCNAMPNVCIVNRLALQMNVLSVRQIMKLCRQLKNLVVFVHTSTAYSNCERPYIEEKVYPPPVDPNRLLEAAEYVPISLL